MRAIIPLTLGLLASALGACASAGDRELAYQPAHPAYCCESRDVRYEEYRYDDYRSSDRWVSSREAPRYDSGYGYSYVGGGWAPQPWHRGPMVYRQGGYSGGYGGGYRIVTPYAGDRGGRYGYSTVHPGWSGSSYQYRETLDEYEASTWYEDRRDSGYYGRGYHDRDCDCWRQHDSSYRYETYPSDRGGYRPYREGGYRQEPGERG